MTNDPGIAGNRILAGVVADGDELPVTVFDLVSLRGRASFNLVGAFALATKYENLTEKGATCRPGRTTGGAKRIHQDLVGDVATVGYDSVLRFFPRLGRDRS